MSVSIPAWIILSVVAFLIFIMVFVTTGSIDDLRMRENYSGEQEDLYSDKFTYKKPEKPVWARTPEITFEEEEKKSLQ
jgi:hypothetical protein